MDPSPAKSGGSRTVKNFADFCGVRIQIRNIGVYSMVQWILKLAMRRVFIKVGKDFEEYFPKTVFYI